MADLESLGNRLYAFLRGESEEAPEDLLTDDFTGHLTDGLPLDLGGDYDGLSDMIERGWGRVGQSFNIQPEPDALVTVGDDLLIARGHYVGHAADGGKPVRAAFAHFWTLKGDKFASVYQVTDSATWEQALN